MAILGVDAGLWLVNQVAVPLVVNIASNVLGDKAPAWLAQYRNHDIPAALAKAWKRACTKVFEDYIKDPPHALSSGHAEAIRALATFLTSTEQADAIFASKAPGNPLSDFRTTPVGVFALDKLAVQRAVSEIVAAAAQAMNPPPRLPESFTLHMQDRLSTALFYYFVEIAVKEDEKAREQINFENAVETFRQLWNIEAKIDSTHGKLDIIIDILTDGSGPGGKSNIAPPCTVPTPSPTFVPRKNITKKIHETLQKNPHASVIRQAVTRAYGGYGKTVAAILYAEEYKASYPGGRFFLPIESADITQVIAGLTTPLGLTATNTPAADAQRVKQRLEAGEPSLLILDNVESKAAWQAMLASDIVPRGECRVLITTRDDTLAPGDDIAIGRLEPAEAREVFRLFCEDRRDKEQDVRKREALPTALPQEALADEITAWVGGLAVAVAAVAARMKLTPHLSWEHAWVGDGKKLKGLKNTPVAELPDVRADVREKMGLNGMALEEHRRTLRVIDDALDALSPPECRAVEYAALLPADMAPAIWLEQLLEADAARGEGDSGGTPDPLKITLTADPDDPLSAAQAVLRHLDVLDVLLQGGEGGKLLSLHRLWHARMNERTKSAKRDIAPLWSAVAACAMAREVIIVGTDAAGTKRGPNNPAAITDQSLRWELTPLAAVCEALWERGAAGDAAGIGVWLATVLKELSHFAKAATCLLPVCEHEAAVEQAIGPAGLASCYSNLATIQKDQGDLPVARASIERAIAIDQKHFPRDDPIFATHYSNLATIQHAQHDLPGARASMKWAIAIDLKHFPPDHPNFVATYSNLAMIQQAMGDLLEARVSMEQSIAIQEKRFAPDHHKLAVCYCNFALIQWDLGDLEGARASMERAIRIGEKSLGTDHSPIASYYSNLAMILKAQGHLPESRVCMERAIAIEQKHFPPDHPNFATRYNNLGHIELAQGNTVEASANFRAALAILLKHFDEDHPHVKCVRRWMKTAGCGG